MTFPIDRVNHRAFDGRWSGEVFICDIDRTYLATRVSSLKGMARIPFEFAIDKKDIAGMAVLLQEVRRGPDARSRHTPLYFVSASPAQLRSVIQHKMMIDGLEFDGTTFKDWVQVIRRGRLARFREQVGFKLTALLTGRLELPAGARETLMGDDQETDALTFSLYADILGGQLVGDRMHATLKRHGVARDDAEAIAEFAAQVAPVDGVKQAIIRLERHDDAAPFRDHLPFLVGCWGAFQMSVALCEAGSIAVSGAVRVVRDLWSRGATGEQLVDRLRDGVRRGIVTRERAEALREVFTKDGGVALPSGDLGEIDPAWAAALRRTSGPRTPESLLAS